MNLKLRNVVSFILLTFFFSIISNAADTYRLNGDYYVRGDNKDFVGTNNLVGTLLAGTEFKVIQTMPQGFNGQAFQIEILKLGSRKNAKSNLNKTEQIWIYKPKSESANFEKLPDVSTETTVSAETTAEVPVKKETQAGVSAAGTKCEGGCSETTLNPIPQSQASVAAVAQHVQTETSRPRKSTRAQVVEELAAIPASEITPDLPTLEKPVEPSTEKKPGSMDEQIANYSQSDEVRKMIDWAMKNKSARSGGICYRKVKEAMATKCGPPMGNGYSCRTPAPPRGEKWGNNLTPGVSTDIKDLAALSAKDRLKEQGFVNLLDTEPYKTQMNSPSNAPKGAILVFSSGIRCRGTNIRDCGHVEIKTDGPGKPGYVSDYYSKDAINETDGSRKTGSPFKLVGVMIKPGVSAAGSK